MANVRIIPASHLQTDAAPNFDLFRLKLLAQGDSWFSINGLSLFTASSILMRMRLSVDTIIANCADPGDTLKNMVQWRKDPYFYRYFAGGRNYEIPWDALLLSGGGNDLINAMQKLPVDDNGVPRRQEERLLLTKEERAPSGPISRYVSATGWDRFKADLLDQYHALGAMRDGSALNQGTPIFTHCYSYIQPRDLGAGFGIGPWLYPAVVAYEVPQNDWLPLAEHFIDLLHDDIIIRTGLKNFYVVDTRKLIPPAPVNLKKPSPYWLNEIHPTAAGYDLLCPQYTQVVESVLLSPAVQPPVRKAGTRTVSTPSPSRPSRRAPSQKAQTPPQARES